MQVALDHGVWDAARPDVGFMLTLQLPAEEEDTCHWDKVDILEQQELTPSQSFALRGGEAPPEEMMAFLRLMNIAGKADCSLHLRMRCSCCGERGATRDAPLC